MGNLDVSVSVHEHLPLAHFAVIFSGFAVVIE